MTIDIGPVQLIVYGFDKPKFGGGISAELKRLRELDLLRVIDAMVVYKNADGEVKNIQVTDLNEEQAERFGAILGGLIVLASSVTGARRRRMREVAILKTVGATRTTLAGIFCTEFAVIGAAAGLIGGTLATVASAVLIGQLLDTPYKFSWPPVFIAALITAALTVLTGWLASYGTLNRKPLDILREIES